MTIIHDEEPITAPDKMSMEINISVDGPLSIEDIKERFGGSGEVRENGAIELLKLPGGFWIGVMPGGGNEG